MLTDTPIYKAATTMSGDALVQFLVDHTGPTQEAEHDPDRYTQDPGVSMPVPGDISEVTYLADTGVLDFDTYLKFLKAFGEKEGWDPDDDDD